MLAFTMAVAPALPGRLRLATTSWKTFYAKDIAYENEQIDIECAGLPRELADGRGKNRSPRNESPDWHQRATGRRKHKNESFWLSEIVQCSR